MGVDWRSTPPTPQEHTQEGSHVSFSASSNGDTEIVAAVPGEAIHVLLAEISATGKATAKFRSASSDLEGGRPLKRGFGTKLRGKGWSPVFKCGVGEALNVNVANLATSGLVTGSVAYRMEP